MIRRIGKIGLIVPGEAYGKGLIWFSRTIQEVGIGKKNPTKYLDGTKENWRKRGKGNS